MSRHATHISKPCHTSNPSPLLLPLPSTTIHAPTLCRERLRSTGLRAVFAEWDDFGFLFNVCDDAVWAVLNTPAGGVLRARPEIPAPADLGANANPAARDVFKRATDSRAAWLACSASFCAAILESIGEGNRLAISDAAIDTLRLSPRDIIISMTALHGTMTVAEVDAIRLSLRKKLTAIADLPSHIVAFRGTLSRLTTVGQVPLALDAYRWFLATLSPFPVFQQHTLLFTVAHGAIASKRLRPMPLTFCRNCTTSLPTPTLDSLREISKVKSSGQTRIL